ncbi:MAG: tetratricopeptide repeat protein [Candidatus Melainabacteria bacterium]|nr:tetratricopeptide repeat protein [Candidatus Melainabacteria bacterium]
MKRKFRGAKQFRLPLSGLAIALVLSGSFLVGEALAANGTAAARSAVAKKSKAAQLAKAKAASLLSAPMSASLDTAPPRSSAESPSVAPPVENGRTRAHRYLREGARLHRIGEYAEAERLFREAVANDPRNPDGFFNLGALAEGRGDLIDALTQYHAGLSIKPNDPALKEAVDSIEKRLAAGERAPSHVENQRYASFKYPQTMFSNPNPTMVFEQQTPLLSVQPPEVPQLTPSMDPAPVLPVSNNGPFQLNSTQNANLGNNGSYGSLNSNLNANSSQPPVVGVRQPSTARRVGGSAFSAILNIGMRSALSGTGLHCPACRLLRF